MRFTRTKVFRVANLDSGTSIVFTEGIETLFHYIV